jgi:hypothetical protein
MRKIAIATVILGLVAAAPAMSASLAFDTFSYPNGNLVPNGGWALFAAGTNNVDVQVASGRATGGAIGNPGNDDHLSFTPQALTVKTYACFDVLIPAFVGAPKPIYFAAIKDAGVANFVSRVYVLPLAGGGWTLGLSHSSTSSTVGVVPWTAALSSGVNYHVVINYDPVNHSSTLWVNPTVESDPSVSITNAAIPALAASTFALRQSNSASTLPAVPAYTGTADWNFSVDNLGIGSTFDDACAIPTPTRPATWGQIKANYR